MPWQFTNSDFEGLDRYQLYVLSVYWVCTVITTVGYGDYSGGTTLEYMGMIGLEFFGLVCFAVLQVCINMIVSYDISYENFINEKDMAILMWLYDLENSKNPETLSKDLYE